MDESVQFKAMKERAEKAEAELSGYKECQESTKSLVREIDAIISDGNPAKQASLCDLVRPIQALKDRAWNTRPSCHKDCEKVKELTEKNRKLKAALGQADAALDGFGKGGKLKEFARKIIKEYCWGMEMDELDIQDLAEKFGLIVPYIVTEDDVDDESDFGVGDRNYKFSEEME